MEDGLRDMSAYAKESGLVVLILVVMEDGLRAQQALNKR